MYHLQHFEGDILPNKRLGEYPKFIVIHFVLQYFEMQWNLSIEDPSGTLLPVLSCIERCP